MIIQKPSGFVSGPPIFSKVILSNYIFYSSTRFFLTRVKHQTANMHYKFKISLSTALSFSELGILSAMCERYREINAHVIFSSFTTSIGSYMNVINCSQTRSSFDLLMIYLMQITTYLQTMRRSLQLRDDLSSDLYAL